MISGILCDPERFMEPGEQHQKYRLLFNYDHLVNVTIQKSFTWINYDLIKMDNFYIYYSID